MECIIVCAFFVNKPKLLRNYLITMFIYVYIKFIYYIQVKWIPIDISCLESQPRYLGQTNIGYTKQLENFTAEDVC